MKKFKLRIVVFSGVILLFLILSTIFYLTNGEKLERRSKNFIGDGVCANLPSEKERNDCCENIHKNDFHIACIGNWTYLKGTDSCEFVCLVIPEKCEEENC